MKWVSARVILYAKRNIVLALLAPLLLFFAYLLPTSSTGPVNFADAQLGRYEVDYSLRFNDDDSPNITKTFTQVGSTTEWTFSTWVKRGNLSSAQYILGAGHNSSNYTALLFDSSDRLQYINVVSGSTNANKITNAVFRDPAAWMHIVLAVDTSQGTAAERNRLYVNGTEITSFGTDTNHGSGNVTWVTDNNDNANTNIVHYISRNPTTAANYFDGYLSEASLIDGQQLTPSSFGFSDSNGYWRPKAYLGTSSGANSFFGTNGFYFNFASTTALGWNLASTTSSGAAWTATNLDATDQVIDTPSHSFATWNPLNGNQELTNGSVTFSNGSLQVGDGGTTYGIHAKSTIAMSSGKWYWEINASTVGGNYGDIGIRAATTTLAQADGGAGYFYFSDGTKCLAAPGSGCSAYGSSYTSGDIISVAYDADNGKIFFAKNGTWQNSGDPAAGTGAAFTGISNAYPQAAAVGDGQNSTSYVWVANFGQGGQSGLAFDSASGGYFKYTPPSGYEALSTANMPDVAIQKPSNYFDAVAYTGDGGATKSISSLAFAPSFVWLKNRSSAYSHTLFDSIRGAGSGMCLFSNATSAEGGNCDSTYGYLSSFDSLGFTVTKGSDATSYTNGSSQNYISWNWKESATSGFDIVTYTGDGNSSKTISHSLGVAPAFVIHKSRNATGGWPVYHQSLGATGAVQLESTGAFNVSSTYWNDTAPNSSAITVGSGLNTNNTTYVMYAFAEVPGFSKFGSYTGNGSADGPFVYTGFKPRFIMVKRSDSSTDGDWRIVDTARDPENGVDGRLFANGSNVESTGSVLLDSLSNGFKSRSTDANASSGTYIYAAFAEQPFKLSATNRYPFLASFFEPSGETIFTKAVSITGGLSVQYQLSKGAGTFVIDHPLDPKNKLLYHSFVESPDQKNIYDGIVELDENGEAVVELPDYFLALNTDYRYLATPIGEPMPELHLDRGVMRRWFGLIGAPAFKLSGGVPGGRVSWQVTGVRQDPYALNHPIIPEVEKGSDQLVEKGEYLHPEFYTSQ